MSTLVVVEASGIQVVEVGPAGPQGPTGATGPQGEQGPQGVPGENYFRYLHEQANPALVWEVTHDLNGYPNVTVEDSAGTVIEGAVSYVSADVVEIAFTVAVSGKAYLS